MPRRAGGKKKLVGAGMDGLPITASWMHRWIATDSNVRRILVVIREIGDGRNRNTGIDAQPL